MVNWSIVVASGLSHIGKISTMAFLVLPGLSHKLHCRCSFYDEYQ